VLTNLQIYLGRESVAEGSIKGRVRFETSLRIDVNKTFFFPARIVFLGKLCFEFSFTRGTYLYGS